MDWYLIDIHWLSARARIQNFEIKPTDGTTLFVYLGKGEKFQIYLVNKIKRERLKIKWRLRESNQALLAGSFRVLTTTYTIKFRCLMI